MVISTVLCIAPFAPAASPPDCGTNGGKPTAFPEIARPVTTLRALRVVKAALRAPSGFGP